MTTHAIPVKHARAPARGLPRMSRFAREHLVALPAGAAAALLWANTWPETYYRFAYAADFWVNDVAMAVFFAVVMKEVVEATAPGGVLHTWRRILPPVAAAIGAAGFAVLACYGFARLFGETMVAAGWPAAVATDLAAAFFAARLVFGRHPAVPFVLLLGIAANVIGVLAIAVAHPMPDARPGVGIFLMGAAVAVAAGLRVRGTRRFEPYVVLAGPIAWAAFYLGGVHPAFALLPIVPFLPHAKRDPGFFADAPHGARDALNQFERVVTWPAQAALLLFGLVNAGVLLRGLEAGVWTVPLAGLMGKPVGVLVGAAVAVAAGLHLPSRVGWRDLVVIGLLAGTGFTMALFFATAALPPGQLLAETKTGALLTAGMAIAAVGVAKWLQVGRFDPRRGDS
jgi:NhaA family Na+:H+ antiporter